MRTRCSQEFLLLCRCLTSAPESGDDRLVEVLSRSQDLCARVVYWATEHFVTPYLYERLSAKGLLSTLPRDLAEFLATFHELNAERNAGLKAQLVEVARTVGDGMSLVVLKGGANLVESKEAEIGRWMMNDLDVLVTAGNFDDSRAEIECLGYRRMAHVGGPHAITYAHPDRPAALEFHFDVGPQRDILPAAMAVARAEPVVGMPAQIQVLAPTDRILHNIWHAQIQDRRHELAIMSLQQLLNFATIVERAGPRIEWPMIEERFRRQRHCAALSAYLYLARRLMGVTVPYGPSDDLRSRIHLRRALVELDSRVLRAIVTHWAIMTPELSRDRIGYAMGRDVSGLQLLAARAGIVSGHVRRHRFRLFAKIAEVRRKRYGVQ